MFSIIYEPLNVQPWMSLCLGDSSGRSIRFGAWLSSLMGRSGNQNHASGCWDSNPQPSHCQPTALQPSRRASVSAPLSLSNSLLEAETWLDPITSKPVCFADWAIESSCARAFSSSSFRCWLLIVKSKSSVSNPNAPLYRRELMLCTASALSSQSFSVFPLHRRFENSLAN